MKLSFIESDSACLSERWRPDYIADISKGHGHINNYVSVSGITIEDGGHDFTIFLRLDRPPNRGQHPTNLELFACKRAPAAVSAMSHPSNFQPRKNIAGWVQDPGRKQLMWQDSGNGARTWQAPPLRLLAGLMASSVNIQCPTPTSECGHCFSLKKVSSGDTSQCDGCHIFLGQWLLQSKIHPVPVLLPCARQSRVPSDQE